MKKQIVLFIVALAFILTITGAVSAGPTTNTTSTQYQIGQTVTQQALADTTLNMNRADKNLVITTVSTAHLNGTTTEDSLQAVVDKTSTLKDGQKITYGSGNLLVIDDPDGSLWYTFISQTGTNLMAKTFTISQAGTITASKTVNIGATQSSANFQQAIAKLGSNGYNIAAIANLWAISAPADLLATTYTTGTINQGSMINYAIIKQFQQNYPSATVGNDSWTAVTSNYIFTNPGNSGIDAAIYGEYGFAYYYYVMNGGDPSKIAIMQYNEDSKTGLIAVIKENSLRNAYGSVVSGTLSEIKFNNWLYNNYLNNPTNLNKLYSVVMLKKIDETAYKYLWFDSELGYGHGLDEGYISQLQDLGGSFNQSQSVVPVTDVAKMKQLGIEAFNQAQTALKYSNTEDFINDIKSGSVGVISLPYYYNVMINGKSTSLAGFLDGINHAGIFSIHNLMTASSHVVWGWDSVQALFLHVTKLDLNNTSNTVIESTLTTAINTNPTDLLSNWGGVKGMKAAWAQQEPYDYMMTLSRVGCRCSAQDYYSAMWGMEKYPLSPNEHYMIMSLSGFSQLDSARTTIFGVSPSQGTYLTPGDTNDASAMYILIKWNSVTNTGIAALVKYDSAIGKAIMENDGYKNSFNWFLDKVLKNTAYLNSAFSVAIEIPLTPDSLDALTGAGGNPVSYMSNYTSPTASTDIGSGTYNADQTITLTASSGTTIHYTLDGTTPTLNSAVYTNPIAITKTSALQFIAVDQNGYISPVYTQNYTIEKPTEPTNPTNPTNPGQNYPETPTTVSAATETTPATTTETPPAPAKPTSTPTSTSSNIPIGAIVGVIILAIAAILIYLARDTITATIKGTGKPGK